MKIHNNIHILIYILLTSISFGQAFDSGSDGSYGAIDITTNTTLTPPADGIFHATTINVASGVLLSFSRNAANTPIYLLAQGDVTMQGDIRVSASNGSDLAGGLSGPGGFDGGNPGSSGSPPGDGHGPGAGRGGGTGGTNLADSAGPATYLQNISSYVTLQKGSTYGSALLIPLAGGSGGGGSTGFPGAGGGGGGGALLIASNTKITLGGNNSDLFASGGFGSGNQSVTNGGSGGAIRLVAPVIISSGCNLWVNGNDSAGAGRIRIDTLDRSALNIDPEPAWAVSMGSMMVVFPDPLPKLDITNAAGTDIAEGSAPVFVNLPFGTDPNQTVTIQARDFNAIVPIQVVLTPDAGDGVKYEAEIDNVSANPATVTVDVAFPVNVTTHLNVWTR
jgi:hypothetical protein